VIANGALKTLKIETYKKCHASVTLISFIALLFHFGFSKKTFKIA